MFNFTDILGPRSPDLAQTFTLSLHIIIYRRINGPCNTELRCKPYLPVQRPEKQLKTVIHMDQCPLGSC